MNKNKKNKFFLFSLVLFAVALISLSSAIVKTTEYNYLNALDTYTLTLDKKNRVSEDISNKDLIFQTDSKSSNVAFRYTNVNALEGYHASLSSSSKITNKDRMTSITKVLASFEGSLTLKTSLDKSTWTSYTLTSGTVLDLSSTLPYYIELSTSSTAKLSAIIFTYTCTPNQSSAPTTSSYKKITSTSELTSGDYLIVYEDKGYVFDGSLTTLDTTNNYKALTIKKNEITDSNADKYAFTIDTTKGTIKSKSGYYIGRTGTGNGLESDASSIFKNTFSISGGDVDIVSYSTYLRFNSDSKQPRFRYFKKTTYSTHIAIQLYKKTETTSVPVTATSFSVVDNTSIYYADSIFDTANQLVVTAITNTGSVTLTSDEYTYKVLDSSSNEIDTSIAFGSEGTYTLVVYYQSLTPVKKTFEVRKARVLSSISLNIDKTEYKIGTKLSDYTSQISATLTYDDDTSINVSYNSFSNYSLTLTLYQDDVVCSLDTAFNSSSTYLLKLTSEKDSSLSSTMKLTVKTMDAWTILIYMCGSNLESDDYLATGDIKEMLSVNGQPDDVKIVIETGGSTKWSSTYNISNKELGRYEISNNQLTLKEQIINASMGASSTFQSFLEWGLKEYPADKTGVIMWNHGGGMTGVCSDDNFLDDDGYADMLTNAELQSALKTTFTNLNRTEKLEWIGYDACLMQVQDIAETNSHYFNYMVASEESESGYGWDYDNWLDDLYAYKNTETVLTEICDTFIADFDTYSEPNDKNNETLSVLDLNKMEDYKNAFEDMAQYLYNKNKDDLASLYSSIASVAKTSKYYEYDKNDPYYFSVFDGKDLLTNLKNSTTFSSDSTLVNYINIALSKYDSVVIYNKIGEYAGESNGMSIFFMFYYLEDYYTTDDTNFVYWRKIQIESE